MKFKWDKKMIESLLKNVFKKVNRQKVKTTVCSPQYKNIKNLLKIL